MEGSHLAGAALGSEADLRDVAKLHSVLRFAMGITAAFVLSEAMGWFPTFVAPLLTAVLLANLPVAPPLKVGLMLAVVMAISAAVAFALSSFLGAVPFMLFGVLGLVIFAALYTMAKGQAVLPMTLLLLCVATIPVVSVVVPAYADILPTAMARGMAIAVVMVWLAFAIWPQVTPPAPKPPSERIASPLRLALTGTAIVMPLLLGYLIFGLTDALPVLVTTVLLVATFDVSQGAIQGVVMVVGNLLGGFIGLIAFLILGIAPSLFVLGLVTFLFAVIAGEFVSRGGAPGALALLTCNSALIIFSIALANPDSSAGIWLTRLFQFCLAWIFAIGMMWAIMPKRARI